jgi:hypothetical protein
LRAVLAAAVILFCSGRTANAETASAATIASGCSQEDYAALVIELPPDIAIEIAGVGAAPFKLALSPLRRDPNKLTEPFARAQLRQPSAMPIWLSGELRIDRLVLGNSAAGSYDFVIPGGGRISGSFDAVWKVGTSGCG